MRNLVAVAIVAVVLSNVSCNELLPPPHPPENPFNDGNLPSLETLPFGELGRGKIVFERVAGNALSFGGIYVIDAAARRSYLLFNYRTLPAGQPAFAPNGAMVAFSAFSAFTTEPPCCGSQLHVLAADGSDVREIGAYGKSYGLSWTPDGSQIMVTASDSLGTSIYRQDTSRTTSPKLVYRFETTPDSTWTLYPPVSVSPSGRLLIAAMRRSVSPRLITWKGILAMNADGSDVTRFYTLPDSFSRAVAATWSPDGHRIAFIAGIVDSSATHRQWTTTVQVINEDGTNRRQVSAVPTFGLNADGYVSTFGEPVPLSLCWTSDGSHIVFSAPVEAENWHLFVTSADGSSKFVEPVTSAPGWQDTSVSCSL